MYSVYVIKNNFGKLYIGISASPFSRVHYHNRGRGSQFTKGKAKFGIVFREEYPTIAEARKREIQIKKWRRDKKEILIERYQKGLPTKR